MKILNRCAHGMNVNHVIQIFLHKKMKRQKYIKERVFIFAVLETRSKRFSLREKTDSLASERTRLFILRICGAYWVLATEEGENGTIASLVVVTHRMIVSDLCQKDGHRGFQANHSLSATTPTELLAVLKSF